MVRSSVPEGDARVLDAEVALADEVFSWIARNVRQCVAAGSGEQGLLWAIIAGKVADTFCCSQLADEMLESALRQLGARLPPASKPEIARGSRPLRWLHVLSRCYETGGHTALCRRWVEADSSQDVHSAVLVFQDERVIPDPLRACFIDRGGEFLVLTSESRLMERAAKLRSLAEHADVVVLHTHMWDPVATVAFAHPGGPPVLLANHADHTYWTGASVADLVLNIRPSGESVCFAHRGNERSHRFPIPLPAPMVLRGDPSGLALRAALGIPESATVFLTIGSGYKYVPTGEMNFQETASKLLQAVPGSFLLAVGPKTEDPRWASLSHQTDRRAIAVGEQTDLRPYLAAADVYLEGFPFGSLTAMLEAVLAGIPPVLAPASCPLPYRSDDFALATLEIPKDADQYVLMAVDLAARIQRDAAISFQWRETVVEAHCLPGWSKELAALRQIVAAGLLHSPRALVSTAPLQREVIRYWARFAKRRRGEDNAFGYAFRRAMKNKLNPSIDRDMYRALRIADQSGLRVPNPLKSYAASKVLSWLPGAWARKLYLKESLPNTKLNGRPSA